MMSTLISRNVTIAGHRTSIRLEPEMWDAMEEVCRAKGLSVHDFCSQVDQDRRASSLTAAVRVALLGHFRAASRDLAPGRPGRREAAVHRAAAE